MLLNFQVVRQKGNRGEPDMESDVASFCPRCFRTYLYWSYL